MVKLKKWEIQLETVRVRKGRRDPMDVAQAQLEAKKRRTAQLIEARRKAKKVKKKRGIVSKTLTSFAKAGLAEARFAFKQSAPRIGGDRRRRR